MELAERPRFREFQARLGTRFLVSSLDGKSVGEWILDQCELLPKPPLESLNDADCYSLCWIGVGSPNQSLYQFVSADGFKTTLFAVPLAPGRLWVTIN